MQFSCRTVLITNLFDLTTYEVVMLYAYRWQIELCFRFIKRTLKGIHLMSHQPDGIEIQFYLYMIGYLLLMAFKQKCEKISDAGEEDNKSDDASEVDNEKNGFENFAKSRSGRHYVRGLVSMLGEGLKKYWKIGLHWLKALQNFLLKTFDENIAILLARYG